MRRIVQPSGPFSPARGAIGDSTLGTGNWDRLDVSSGAGGIERARSKPVRMTPDLESIMLQKSIGSMESDRPTCSRCRRSPLVGEFLYRLESAKLVCGLCLSDLPGADQAPVESERVHAAERSIPVAKRAA